MQKKKNAKNDIFICRKKKKKKKKQELDAKMTIS